MYPLTIRRRSGGALLGDRIRMNSTSDSRVYTVHGHAASECIGAHSCQNALHALKAAGLTVIPETAGITRRL